MSDPKLYGMGTDWGSSVWWDPDKKEDKPLTKMCSCGTTITMGRDDQLMHHSDWCDLVRKEDK